MSLKIFIFTISMSIVLLNQCLGIRRHAGVTDDLPLKKDLKLYIESLRKVIEFTSAHKLDLDLNYLFGIFLLQVNLKIAMESKSSLRKSMSNDIAGLLTENEKLLRYFKFKVDTDYNEKDKKDKSIAKLFENHKIWTQRVPKLKLTRRLRTTRRSDNIGTYFKWPEYRENVEKFNKWIPNPEHSDRCIASLGDSDDKMNYNHKCKVQETCRDMLTNGTDFGYAMLHRLLFLQSARYGRGCSIFSPAYDDELRNKFCSIAYVEAERIVQHDFDGLDLLFEQCCLCSLDGHVEFLNRSWLSKLLEKQSIQGCFGRYSKEMPITYVDINTDKTWVISKSNHQLLGGHCDGHFTSVAAASLGAAVRFILENY